MKIHKYDSYSDLSLATAELIADIISDKPDSLLCFPAGETSIGTFKELIRLNKERQISFSKCRIVGLDEWVGLGEMRSENCFSFLKKHFFDHIDLSSERMCFFNSESSDLQHEVEETDNFIKEYSPIDMILLGAGMNGHLGLNEPGSSFDLCSHLVELDNTTKSTGQKYFSGKVKLSRGITIGLKQILESKTAILQLSGKHKALVAGRMLKDEVSVRFPASALKLHQNSYLMIDKDAATGE
ncbi:MAG TPA: glucosamine-6-phosphate deaminase [Bacteroidales bacterium]|nr:glucosamine-6-phosphate deaminase [Bacteroidales bacterium]